VRTVAIAISSLALIAAAHAGEDLVVKRSQHSVAQTMDRFEAALKEKNIGVVARWDHAAKAETVGMKLRPTQLIIFGNPKLGTPLMQSNPRAGVDLPLKVLVWEDETGAVWIGYTAPQALAQRYAIRDRDEVVGQIAAALDGLTQRAAQP
jgi:uncharacterized protein (DUF302 family)